MIDHHEEPWEAEISALLGGLGAVDPPEGFLERAVDRPPVAAGRVVAGLVAALVAVTGIAAATGWTSSANSISPDFTALETRHRTVAPVEPSAATVDDEMLPPGVPAGFVVVDRLDGAPWDHEVVQRARGTVSVFRQPGSLDVTGLDGTWERIGSTEVFVAADGVAMFEHDDEVLVVVGLEPDELVEPEPSTITDRLGDVVVDLTRELGFPS